MVGAFVGSLVLGAGSAPAQAATLPTYSSASGYAPLTHGAAGSWDIAVAGNGVVYGAAGSGGGMGNRFR